MICSFKVHSLRMNEVVLVESTVVLVESMVVLVESMVVLVESMGNLHPHKRILAIFLRDTGEVQ